jgi:hypothetical protein
LHEAAALIPGATSVTLKRRARQGRLVTYRPGKAYLTTAADVQRMVEACRVVQKAPGSGLEKHTPAVPPHGLSETDLSNAALDSALTSLGKPSKP